jgi:thiosulfate dehydrogenase (quinone) large subunit
MNKTSRDYILPVLTLVVAYEWLISSIDKMLTKNYVSAFRSQLSQGVSDIHIHPYANLVKSIGIPQYHLLSIVVVIAELFVALSFIFYAVHKFMGKNNKGICRTTFIASIAAAFMSLNYAILGGDTLFTDPANAFQEGISIDWIFFLIETTLAFYFYSQIKRINSNENEERMEKAA